MKVLLHPTYFPNIATFAVMAQKDVIWETSDNYQKQTYRNRCHICTDQGRQMLNIPIKHVGGNQGRQRYREVCLDNSYPWQKLHFKTLQTAYRSSPFFEFYEDLLAPLFEERFDFLLDFNLRAIETICSLLAMDFPSQKKETYEVEPSQEIDGRFLVIAKRTFDVQQRPYGQVFEDRNGFVPNCSILDLLFNEGTNSLNYLRQQKLDFLDA
ncbi:WbqC family protein [Allomuricauda sp. SCSIO 65647]|uniref:WbqC family protein n=1 Tax=Allomuricauda sp. SCSIO 65647 TaxID=2908843 RepID=UPI001F2E2E90|nr:WbqC family protein [Muricauda sp. SCSIO 65647]UJH67889.1 WbqC family protein [Muricauda sp. SCSIO 65647]